MAESTGSSRAPARTVMRKAMRPRIPWAVANCFASPRIRTWKSSDEEKRKQSRGTNPENESHKGERHHNTAPNEHVPLRSFRQNVRLVNQNCDCSSVLDEESGWNGDEVCEDNKEGFLKELVLHFGKNG